jgi:hypothetical protein
MPLYGNHLFGSEFNARANDAGWRAAVTLWWAAWNQCPAASLPNDEIALCRLADLGRDKKRWEKVREVALHGFVLCSDGRLYHTFLAPLAKEAWQRRVRERERKAEWRDRKERVTRTETDLEQGQRRGQDAGRDADVPAERRGEERTVRGEDSIKNKTVVAVAVSSSAPQPPPPPPPTDPGEEDFFRTPTIALKPEPRRLNLGDLEASYPILLVMREDRPSAETTLALYGFEACGKALTTLAVAAKARERGKNRILVSEMRSWLEREYTLEAEDYRRAGLPVPEGVAS